VKFLILDFNSHLFTHAFFVYKSDKLTPARRYKLIYEIECYNADGMCSLRHTIESHRLFFVRY
jgi:hypothetical protein